MTDNTQKAQAMSPELTDALEHAKQWLASASDDEKAAMWKAQRENWDKGPHGPTDGMGTVLITQSSEALSALRRRYQKRATNGHLSRNERTRCSHYIQALDELAALSQPPEASEVEAVAYASPEQMAAMGDPIGDMAGAYIPLRKTPAGKFTMPLYAHPPKASPVQDGPTFKRGDRVEKISGASWRGTVVGEYSTALTPEGYAVESETETGSVQIYPFKALRLALAQPAPEQGEG